MRNLYGDQLIGLGNGCGVDIASQRADWLDQAACEYLQELFEAGSTPLALDAGCGLGGQAYRMASAGANVLGVDMTQAEFRCQHDSITYFSQNVTEFPVIGNRGYVSDLDVVVMQRMIHYVRPLKAREVMRAVYYMLKPGGQLFISASGLGSELGSDYLDRSKSWDERFCLLDEPMAKKHGIHAPVCLYETVDLEKLVVDSGFRILSSETSQFGNIKVSAKRPKT